MNLGMIEFVVRHLCRPAGTSENSPAIHRWVNDAMGESPVGTAEEHAGASAVPDGTGVTALPGIPAMNRWAIFSHSFAWVPGVAGTNFSHAL